MTEADERALAPYSMQILTYEGLIANARQAYNEYLEARGKMGRIENTLAALV